MMNLLQRRIRHGASIISLLALLPFFIIAQETGKLEIMNCFKKSPVQVSSIYLTCDSSGAYYYGKSSYRGSSTCKYGDIARIKAYCKCESVNVTTFSMPILGAPPLTQYLPIHSFIAPFITLSHHSGTRKRLFFRFNINICRCWRLWSNVFCHCSDRFLPNRHTFHGNK